MVVFATDAKVSDMGSVNTTTSDATPTVIATVAIPSASVFLAEAWVVGKDENTGDMICVKIGQGGKNLSGTAALLGSVTTMIAKATDASLSTAAVAFTVSSGNLNIQVTGVAATTMLWHAEVRVRSC